MKISINLTMKVYLLIDYLANLTIIYCQIVSSHFKIVTNKFTLLLCINYTLCIYYTNFEYFAMSLIYSEISL